MTVGELLALLNDLPVGALDKPIYVVDESEVFTRLVLASIVEEQDGETLAYVILREVLTVVKAPDSVN